MTSNGYIKLFRKMTEWEWYKDTNTKIVFLHLLMIANYKEARYKGIEIHPGQAVIGRRSLSDALGISEQNVRTALAHLKLTNEITIKSTSKFSVVTIENWAFYQSDGDELTNKLTNELTINQPATNHTIRKKERKKYKKGAPSDLEETYSMLEEWANEEE